MYFCSLFYVSGVLIEMKKDTIVGLMCVLWLLIGCGEDKSHRLRQLELLEQANRADSVMRNDSLAEDLVAYFDKNGTPNERMRAYYILGRTYFDLGELPRALETYLKAADCADTKDPECDYKTLSRIHAQSAKIFNYQIQPRSQLKELRLAEYYAKKSNDSLMAIECYNDQSGVYRILNKADSVILIEETVANRFLKIHKVERYAQTLGGAITSLVKKGDLTKAKEYADIYEKFSGYFDGSGNIERGREMYYYAKGEYYLAAHKLDSAEVLFRKLLGNSSLNRQIAGCKGLQQVYEQRDISDSIAKYANLGYILNDSAYSLSEMQNVQMFQASYNYNHKQLLVEQERHRADNLMYILFVFAILVVLGVLIALYFVTEYRRKKNQKILQYRQNLEKLEKTQTELLQLRSQEKQEALDLIQSKDEELRKLHKQVKGQRQQDDRRLAELESKLDYSDISRRLHTLLEKNPPVEASSADFRDLRSFMNEMIPSFYIKLNTSKCSLRPIEYDVCLLVRFHFRPAEISKLTGLKENHVANIRKGILLKVFNIVDSPRILDELLLQIKD